jgi:hypothetical protein
MTDQLPALWTVPVAALASFLVGGVWYAPPVLGRVWQRLAGLSDEELRARNMVAVFGGSFAGALLAAAVLAPFVGREPGPAFGALAGALIGVGWVTTALVTTALFERRPVALALVNGGYQTLSYAAMGAIIGLG